MQASDCELPFDSFLHVPTASNELRSVPKKSESVPGPPAAGRDVHEGRATAEVQSDGSDDSASSVLGEAFGDGVVGLDSWR